MPDNTEKTSNVKTRNMSKSSEDNEPTLQSIDKKLNTIISAIEANSTVIKVIQQEQVDLATRLEKDEFLQKRKAKKHLRAADLGYASESSIYCMLMNHSHNQIGSYCRKLEKLLGRKATNMYGPLIVPST
ncbi:hypothetical protein J6590_066878 [Homalodisca vitripennis]|nr:hypothetical protein J6590_066878 [Homalodisca vitripennis]